LHHAATTDKGQTMEIPTAIAAHAIAFSVLAGLALPVLAARLILAFDKRAPRLVLPSAAATPRPAIVLRRQRLRRLPALAVQYSSAPRMRLAQQHAAPGLASRWKGAHRLAVGA
jgi:hypothetical protein